VVSFSPVSPPRPYTPLSPNQYAPHAQPISFFSILSPAQYWVGSTNHLAPRYAISRNTTHSIKSHARLCALPVTQTKQLHFVSLPTAMSASQDVQCTIQVARRIVNGCEERHEPPVRGSWKDSGCRCCSVYKPQYFMV